MDIRLVIGAHRTGTRHLRKTLEQNADMLEALGICVPARDLTYWAMEQATKALRKGKATEHTAPWLIEKLTDGKKCKHLVIINPHLSGSLRRPAMEGAFYRRGDGSMAKLLDLLDDWHVRFYVATRNPATFIPSAYGASLRHTVKLSFEEYVEQAEPMDLRWSGYLHRLQGEYRENAVTTWSYEDYPYIWREVAQAVTGAPTKEDFAGSLDVVNRGMNLQGSSLMYAYLRDHPVYDKNKFEKVYRAFGHKFPSDHGIAAEHIWPKDMQKALTDNYDDDLYYIDRMEDMIAIRRPNYA